MRIKTKNFSAGRPKKKSILVKIGLVAGTVVLVLIIISIAKEIYQKNQIQKQIDELQQEAEKINKNNSSLQDKIAYLGSQDYQEKEAKDTLDLQSPGENVVVVQPSAAKESLDNNPEAVPNIPAPQAAETSNPVKWWNYFFK